MTDAELIASLKAEVENLKEKVLTLDRVLKENHDQAQQQWEQDQAELSRLREERNELILGLKKCYGWSTFLDYSPEEIADRKFIQSILSKFKDL